MLVSVQRSWAAGENIKWYKHSGKQFLSKENKNKKTCITV